MIDDQLTFTECAESVSSLLRSKTTANCPRSSSTSGLQSVKNSSCHSTFFISFSWHPDAARIWSLMLAYRVAASTAPTCRMRRLSFRFTSLLVLVHCITVRQEISAQALLLCGPSPVKWVSELDMVSRISVCEHLPLPRAPTHQSCSVSLAALLFHQPLSFFFYSYVT